MRDDEQMTGPAYGDYEHLLFERTDSGVTLITIDRPDRYNATNDRLHRELADVWLTVGTDSDTRVAVITGAGRAFCAGADLATLQGWVKNPVAIEQAMYEARDIARNLIELDKPVIAAVNGPAVGAGCALAVCADISIMAHEAVLMDGHVALGLVAGDHGALMWPLQCGMAKAKYYLLTNEPLRGREAERLGLVSKSVPANEVVTAATAVAERLAAGSQSAIRWTKNSLNSWLRGHWPILDTSLALEMLTFTMDDAEEGIEAMAERRPPAFPSAR